MRISKGMRNRRRKGRYPICWWSGVGTLKEWRDKKGRLHRTDGPAVVENGRESYYLKGVYYASEFEMRVALATMKKGKQR